MNEDVDYKSIQVPENTESKNKIHQDANLLSINWEVILLTSDVQRMYYWITYKMIKSARILIWLEISSFISFVIILE